MLVLHLPCAGELVSQGCGRRRSHAGTNCGYWNVTFNTAFEATDLDAVFWWARQVGGLCYSCSRWGRPGAAVLVS
jgi:hypothetical protein